jgi:hypothetical protein
MSPLSAMTERFESSEFKKMAKCGSKDVTMKKIFEKMDTDIKQIKVHVKNIEAVKDPSANLKSMFAIVMDLIKLTGTKDFHSYMIKNCPNEVVATNVAESKRVLKQMNDTIAKSKK